MTLTRRASLVLPGVAALVAVLAACTPEEKNGIRITGTLNSALGPSAPLTLSVGEVIGSGFNMTASLDGEPVSGSGTWACYAPLPPDYPNFDIEASDGSTFGFFLSVSPEVWSTGAHPIGEFVHLLVAAPDRFGTAQSGSIFLSAAGFNPDQAGNNCGFSVSGPLALEGEKDR